MSEFLLYVILGLLAGAFSGLIGLGGGVIIVPALVFIFGMSQIQAQGTMFCKSSLALPCSQLESK